MGTAQILHPHPTPRSLTIHANSEFASEQYPYPSALRTAAAIVDIRSSTFRSRRTNEPEIRRPSVDWDYSATTTGPAPAMDRPAVAWPPRRYRPLERDRQRC